MTRLSWSENCTRVVGCPLATSCQDHFFLEIKLSPLGGNYPAVNKFSSSNFGKSSAFYLLTCKYGLAPQSAEAVSEIYQHIVQ